AHHCAATAHLLRKCNCGVGHGLLVVSAERGQYFPDSMQRLAEASNIAVTENRPHPGKVGHRPGSLAHQLAGEIADRTLRRGEASGIHSTCPMVPRAFRHAVTSPDNFSASEATACSLEVRPANHSRAAS